MGLGRVERLGGDGGLRLVGLAGRGGDPARSRALGG